MNRALLTLAALAGMGASVVETAAPVPASSRRSTLTGGPVVPARAQAEVLQSSPPDTRERLRAAKQARHWAIIMERRAARAARRGAS